jgi:aryl-alcohol dehydrogenase-like predicted oxidoreductase
MEKRAFGKTGLQVTPLGFGGAEIGFEEASDATVERLLNGAIDAGLNVIDTAECYVNSEELIGKAVGHRRGEYHLFTKCGHAEGISKPDWAPAALLRSIDRSLARLRTDRLDLVQLHSCTEDLLRRGEVIEALRKARSDGKTRFIGYSGDGSAARYAVECGAFDTLQTSVSIADQEAVELTLPLAVKHNLGVIAKRPIANAAWKTGAKPASAYHHAYWERLGVLDFGFLKGGLADSVATALRFTLTAPGVHTAIVGTTNPGRWQQNADLVARGPLPDAEFRAIRERWNAVAKPDWVGQT